MGRTIEAPVVDPGLDSTEALQRKRYMVELFDHQAPKYDFHDDAIGLGIHRWWARDIIKSIQGYMRGRTSAKMLDLACGTGFVTFLVAGKLGNIDIDGFDISPQMVAVARDRQQKGFAQRNINLWVGDAELPCGENQYDIITTCFAFRNLVNKGVAAENVFRALKPGGVFVLQDMTKPEGQPARAAYLFALKHLLPIPAKILGTEKGAPRYLYNSVMMMPRNAELKALLESRGFVNVSAKSQTLGMGCLLVGYKPGVNDGA